MKTKPLRNHDKAIKIYIEQGYRAYCNYIGVYSESTTTINRKKKGKKS